MEYEPDMRGAGRFSNCTVQHVAAPFPPVIEFRMLSELSQHVSLHDEHFQLLVLPKVLKVSL